MESNNKFNKFLNDKLVPLGAKISNQPHLKAIRDGMVAATPLALLGGMTLIVTSPPVNLETMKPTNIFFQFLIVWKQWAIQHGLGIELLFRSSMGLMALFVCMAISNSLAKHYKMQSMNTMIIAAVSFLITSAPSNLVVFSDILNKSKTIEKALEGQSMALPMNYLGAEGIFTAIIIGLLVTESTRFLQDRGLLIKMPEAVPEPVKASFASIIPLVVNVVCIFLISLLVQSLTGGLLIPDLIKKLFSPFVFAVDSVVGIFLISIVTQLLWVVGLHGSSIVSGLVGAFELGNLAANAEAVTKGLAPEFIYTEPFRAFFMILGGAGATIGLNILMLRSKDKQMRTLGKLAILPSIFNINEPIIFGVPIVLNPVLAIPFIGVQTVNGILTYIVMKLDILGKTYTYVPWTTPAPIGAAIATMSIIAFFWIIFLIVLDILMWYPFFKTYEKQLLKEEKEVGKE
ncbi:MAG: PTS transporter subunit EIIC [Anaerococcus vaginalis]|uniref:PTS sugar transporter subunit IIC n=1 Tax=Anaerococcus vaginalis TaxID=33037 RepID=UPI0029091891|nr:PTS transporter subunit EIIC [Anaerococcus vaginalis]MDU6181891.1 PTS transporter subunit EIIC [Anaerococcus vaginalis]